MVSFLTSRKHSVTKDAALLKTLYPIQITARQEIFDLWVHSSLALDTWLDDGKSVHTVFFLYNCLTFVGAAFLFSLKDGLSSYLHVFFQC